MTDRRIVEVDDLPDGRRMVMFDDGSCVVVGRAQRHEHPVAGWDWLGAHRRGAPAPRRRTTGASTRSARPTRRTGWSAAARAAAAADLARVHTTRPPGPGTAAHQRADALLRSLLDPTQAEDYRSTAGFWVDTPQGPVRLGRLYHLVHRPVDQPHLERILCVVPRAHTDLPLPDVWTNLLLTLAVEPDEFFRVANLVGTRAR